MTKRKPIRRSTWRLEAREWLEEQKRKEQSRKIVFLDQTLNTINRHLLRYDQYYIYRYLQQRQATLQQQLAALIPLIQKYRTRPRAEERKWVQKLLKPRIKRKKGKRISIEQFNRVSPLFWEIHAALWKNALSKKDTEQMYQQKELPYYQHNQQDSCPFVLSILNIKKLAQVHNVKEDAVRKAVQKWTGQGPYRVLGFTRERKRGGKTIFAIGYWRKSKITGELLNRIDFFANKKPVKEWLRGVFIRPKS